MKMKTSVWKMVAAFTLGVVVVVGVFFSSSVMGQGRLFRFSRNVVEDLTTTNPSCSVDDIRAVAKSISETRVDYFNNAVDENMFSNSMENWLGGNFPNILDFQYFPWDSEIYTKGYNYRTINFSTARLPVLVKSLVKDADTLEKMTTDINTFHGDFFGSVTANLAEIYQAVLDQAGLDRCQYAFMVYEHSGLNIVQPTVPTFADVPVSMYCYEAIETLYAHGIINGYGSGNFLPDDPMDKAGAVKIAVATFLDSPQTCTHNDFFNDVSPQEWYYTYVDQAALNGLLCNIDDFGARDCSMPANFDILSRFNKDWAIQIMSNVEEVGLRNEFCL